MLLCLLLSLSRVGLSRRAAARWSCGISWWSVAVSWARPGRLGASGQRRFDVESWGRAERSRVGLLAAAP
ncbi:hypothetical protein MSMEG_4758 [Mycolicibacterium smegmatis MC2 155]|uniref:Uncharacterized protein n=1 Tax=Mycolicibacterium smegmatis (strain ATCC 700084 / mc(2)155) TaxID=246196 RepID=A0R1H8_MYCS2|nr:hypothetical protein MSMEG_4758 [Mycolicibacterium smegmatis MC2 155]